MLFMGGLGLELMVWTYQGETISHHIDLGALVKGGLEPLSTGDIPRFTDLALGTGIEVKLSKRVKLTVDWKMRIADPIFIVNNDQPVFKDGSQVYGPDGRYLDVKRVLGNSLVQSQLFLGLLIR